MNDFQRNIYRTVKPYIVCVNYTISSSATSAQSYTYIDCAKVQQQGFVGGVGGYDANTFCAQENSITTTSETTVVNNGACV